MTYSIAAFDAATGELGAAVQTHWFCAGWVVPWVRPGVGAVCTQSITEPAYGPRLLDRIAAGEAPQAALDALLAADEAATRRQVGVVDADGDVAVHTGAGCIAFAGHETGAAFCVQANMMASGAVWPAMARAFRDADPQLALAHRLLAALDAAEAAGGDVRGRQSAALLVAPAAGEPWQTSVNLRVDDHPDPLVELARLLTLYGAYTTANDGDEHVAAGRHTEAGAAYARALELAPESDELLFWAGLADAQAGDVQRGADRVRAAIAVHGGWAQLLDRLDAEIAPGAAAVRAAFAQPPGE